MMQAENQFVASDDVVARQVGVKAVLLDLESGTYLGLNDVGGVVWETLEAGPASLATICDAVLEKFDVTREVATRDIADLIDDLLARKLVTRA